jgi:hypothetical protein
MAQTRLDRSFPPLPSRPLIGAISKMLDPFTRLEAACEPYGLSSKTLTEVEKGRREQLEFNTADRIVCHSGLNWWEVWTAENTSPDDLERVRRAFEGTEEEQRAFAAEVAEQERIANGRDAVKNYSGMRGPVPEPFEPFQLELPAPCPALPESMEREELIAQAAELRQRNPAAITWKALAEAMAFFHGFERSSSWWQRTLVGGGLVEPRPVRGSMSMEKFRRQLARRELEAA